MKTNFYKYPSTFWKFIFVINYGKFFAYKKIISKQKHIDNAEHMSGFTMKMVLLFLITVILLGITPINAQNTDSANGELVATYGQVSYINMGIFMW